MPNKNGLSVEIFRDYHSTDPESLSVNPIATSLKSLARIAGKFTILDTTKFLDISDHPSKHINMDGVFLDTNQQPADLNILLTDRKTTYRRRLLRGIAQTLPNKPVLGTRIAIVSTYMNELVTATANHEVGHNLNLAHCDDEECTMCVYNINKDQECTAIYCQNCTDQLRKNVGYLRKAKMGKKVSKQVLFPSYHAQFPDDPFFAK